MGLLARLARDRYLPVAVLDDAAEAAEIADDVCAFGLSTLEITLRTPAGLPGIAATAAREDVCVGAGTVVSPRDVDAVVEAGARFVVTPGWHPPVVERCLELGVPVLPGVATPGEVMGALALGIEAVKLFPAMLGGPALVDALAGPFPRLRLVPSGGIRPPDVAAYLSRPSVLAVSGSWSTWSRS